MTAPRPTPRADAAVTLAGGRVVLAHDGQHAAIAAAGADGDVADVRLSGPAAQSWAARVATVLRVHPPGTDVTPAELRTPWLRGDDGEPALAVERTTRGPAASWRLLLRAPGREVAVALSEGDVATLLHRLAVALAPSREVG